MVGVDIAGDVLFPVGRPIFRQQGLGGMTLRKEIFKLEDYFGSKTVRHGFRNSNFHATLNYEALLVQLLR